MSDHRDTNQPFWRKDNPIAYGVTLTGIILLGYLILGLRQQCIGSNCETNLQIFWESDPNEIGDTLAGLFSALAFVWIIVTVFLQSHELREQRKELREQRQATQDMARAMGAQAEIFEDEKKYRSESRAKAILEQLLLSLEEHLIRTSSSHWKYRGKKQTRGRTFTDIDGRGRVTRQTELVDADCSIALVRFIKRQSLEENIVKQAELSAKNLKEILAISNDTILSRPKRQPFEDLAGILRDIENTLKHLAEDQEIRVWNLGILRFSKTVHSALEAEIWQESFGSDKGDEQ